MCFFCSSNKAFFDFFSSNSLNFFRRSFHNTLQSLLQSDLVFHHAIENFLSLAELFHFLHQVMTGPFQLRQTFQLRVPLRQAGTVLSLPESLEELLASLIPFLLGKLCDGKKVLLPAFPAVL